MADLTYGVRFSTNKSVLALEDWLESNCAERFSLDVGLSEDLATKSVSVYFQNEYDRDSFRSFYRSMKG